MPENLVNGPLVANIEGITPLGLDLSNHLLNSEGIPADIELFDLIESGGGRLRQRSVAPNDRFLALHKSDLPVIQTFAKLGCVKKLGTLYNGPWTVSELSLPRDDGESFKQAAKLLNLHATTGRWEAELLMPLPNCICRNELRVVASPRSVMLRLRHRRRGSFEPQASLDATMTWVGENAQSRDEYCRLGKDKETILDLPCPGAGRWDLYILGSGGFHAILSFDFVSDQRDQPWHQPKPLSVVGTWNDSPFEADAWADPITIEVTIPVAPGSTRLEFAPWGLPPKVSAHRRFRSGPHSEAWKYFEDFEQQLIAAINGGDDAELIFEAGAFGCARIALTGRNSTKPAPYGSADRSGGSNDDDPLEWWLRTIARVNPRRPSQCTSGSFSLAQLAAVIRTAKGR